MWGTAPRSRSGQLPWLIKFLPVGFLSFRLQLAPSQSRKPRRETRHSGFCEHGIPAQCIGRRDFLLHYVPVFHNFAIFDAEDIYCDHWLWPPAGITPMNYYEVAISDGHAGYNVSNALSTRSLFFLLDRFLHLILH